MFPPTIQHSTKQFCRSLRAGIEVQQQHHDLELRRLHDLLSNQRNGVEVFSKDRDQSDQDTRVSGYSAKPKEVAGHKVADAQTCDSDARIHRSPVSMPGLFAVELSSARQFIVESCNSFTQKAYSDLTLQCIEPKLDALQRQVRLSARVECVAKLRFVVNEPKLQPRSKFRVLSAQLEARFSAMQLLLLKEVCNSLFSVVRMPMHSGSQSCLPVASFPAHLTPGFSVPAIIEILSSY